MYTMTFSRIALEDYTISDTNDSRLLCIGSILVDPLLRKGTKKALYYAAEIGMGHSKSLETDAYLLHLTQSDPETILISLTTKIGEKISYQTDIPLEEFINLIEEYEDALDSDPHTITVTRMQDSFELTVGQ